MKKSRISPNTTLASTMNKTKSSRQLMNSTSRELITSRSNRFENSIDFISALWEEKHDHPIIDEKIQEQIEHKEKIVSLVNTGMRIREATNDNFINYNYNPFIATHVEFEELKRDNKKKNTRLINLIDSMQQSEHSLPSAQTKIEKSKNEMDKISTEAFRRSSKYMNVLPNSTIDSIMQVEKKENKKVVEFNLDSLSKKNTDSLSQITNKPNSMMTKNILIRDEQEEIYRQIEIESIVAQREDRFYTTENVKFNVFKITVDKDECKSAYEILKSKNFEFYGVVEKIPILKIPFCRDLSTFGRGILTGAYKGSQIVVNHLEPNETNPMYQELNFWDIMGVATNRVPSEGVERLLSPNDQAHKPLDFEDSSSYTKERDHVIYHEETLNVQSNYAEALDFKEVEEYHLLKLTAEEDEKEKQCQEENKLIYSNLDFEATLKLNMINEKELHFEILNEREEVFKKYVNSNERDKDMAAYVRYNKYKKDKRDLIEIRELKKMLMKKNEHELAKASFLKTKERIR